MDQHVIEYYRVKFYQDVNKAIRVKIRRSMMKLVWSNGKKVEPKLSSFFVLLHKKE